MQNYISRISLFSILFAFAGVSCNKEQSHPDYRAEMRKFVVKISQKGKTLKPGFIVIPQNGLALLSSDGTPSGTAETSYLNSIDGVGQEELWYGYDNNDNFPPSDADHAEMLGMCSFARDHGLKVLVTDYCNTSPLIDSSYAWNFSNGFISFAAVHRELDNIPDYPSTPFHVSTLNVSTLNDAQNYLYIISPSTYSSKEEFIHAIEQTNYDAVIMDLFFDENTIINTADLARLHLKANGGTRKIICYMSIGEAETYRWYWKPYWSVTPPSFLVAEDPDWLDNFSVRYWDPNWQSIICNGPDSYLNKIVAAGFDGVYLDLVSEYEYFEE